MDGNFVKIPLSVSPDLDAALQCAKSGRYSSVPQDEMLRELIRRGLETARHTSASGAPRP